MKEGYSDRGKGIKRKFKKVIFRGQQG